MTSKAGMPLQLYYHISQIPLKQKKHISKCRNFSILFHQSLVILISWQFKYSVFKRGRFFS